MGPPASIETSPELWLRMAAMPATRALAIAGSILLSASTAFGQNYAVPRHVVAGGGGTSINGSLALTSTIGQPDASLALESGSIALTGGFLAIAFAGAPFTDDPLVTGTTLVRAIHFSELRNRVNALRVRFALSPATWTDPSIGVGVTAIKVQHVEELQTALFEAYSAAGAAPPVFDDTLIIGVTPVRALHVSQLRAAIQFLEEQ